MRRRFDVVRRRGFEALLLAAGIGFVSLASSFAAETEPTVPLEDVPHAEPVSPDSLLAPEAAPPASDPAALPVTPRLRGELASAQQALAEAGARLDAANAAYGNMMARNYPTGEAKAAIVSEREAALAAYEHAAARYRALGGEVPASPSAP